MPAVVLRHLASLTLVFFVVWSWTAPMALGRAQRAATGLAIAGVIFFMTLWPGSARDYQRLIFRVHLPFLAVVALSFSLAIHALRATSALRP
jgi:hypothetical protein